jgi:hypothetical protein
MQDPKQPEKSRIRIPKKFIRIHQRHCKPVSCTHTQVDLVELPPVQAHVEELGHLAGHPHHPVQALVFQACNKIAPLSSVTDPDPLVRGMDPAQDPAPDPDPSIIKQK